MTSLRDRTDEPWQAPRALEPVDLTVSLPGSKSITNRALVLAALAEGPSTIHRALRSRDTTLMADALGSLGADVDTSGDDWTVVPGELVGAGLIDCGLAGTVMRFVPPVAALARRVNDATDENVRRDLDALPGLIDRVDELIERGVIGGDERNAADFQIAPTVRLAMTFQDLRPMIEARPAGKHAERVEPKLPGDIPPILPPAWLEPLRGKPAAA